MRGHFRYNVFNTVKDLEVIFGKGSGSQPVPNENGMAPMWKKKSIFWALSPHPPRLRVRPSAPPALGFEPFAFGPRPSAYPLDRLWRHSGDRHPALSS